MLLSIMTDKGTVVDVMCDVDWLDLDKEDDVSRLVEAVKESVAEARETDE